METFLKSDLAYDDYDWSEYKPNDPRVSGPPDDSVFNRKEGEEVLYIINLFASHVAWDVRSFGKKVEQLIHDHLPDSITSQEEVLEWIRENWNS